MEISNCANKTAVIEKINAVQPKLNAVVTMIDEADNTNVGKLSGVSVALKDNISTCGIRTTASSRILDNYVPVYDATIVKKLREIDPNFPIIATGGPTEETVREVIQAGANAVTFTPPTNGEIFKGMMEEYRHRYD